MMLSPYSVYWEGVIIGKDSVGKARTQHHYNASHSDGRVKEASAAGVVHGSVIGSHWWGFSVLVTCQLSRGSKISEAKMLSSSQQVFAKIKLSSLPYTKSKWTVFIWALHLYTVDFSNALTCFSCFDKLCENYYPQFRQCLLLCSLMIQQYSYCLLDWLIDQSIP